MKRLFLDLELGMIDLILVIGVVEVEISSSFGGMVELLYAVLLCNI